MFLHPSKYRQAQRFFAWEVLVKAGLTDVAHLGHIIHEGAVITLEPIELHGFGNDDVDTHPIC